MLRSKKIFFAFIFPQPTASFKSLILKDLNSASPFGISSQVAWGLARRSVKSRLSTKLSTGFVHNLKSAYETGS
jgi:hypothetical protein